MVGYVYILCCADQRYYYGSTNDLIQRLAQHRAGRVRSTKPMLPVELVYFEECQTLAQARQRERLLKNGPTGTRRPSPPTPPTPHLSRPRSAALECGAFPACQGPVGPVRRQRASAKTRRHVRRDPPQIRPPGPDAFPQLETGNRWRVAVSRGTRDAGIGKTAIARWAMHYG
jgi:predicted GIY-YIG superfamily endonuclease